MTYIDLSNMVHEIGLPYAYSHFKRGERNPDGTAIAPPFICYYWDNDDFYADNVNYAPKLTVYIVLYTAERRDGWMELQVENVLKNHGISYIKELDYLSGEKMFQTAYTMEVLING